MNWVYLLSGKEM